jgi:hypothetical protein
MSMAINSVCTITEDILTAEMGPRKDGVGGALFDHSRNSKGELLPGWGTGLPWVAADTQMITPGGALALLSVLAKYVRPTHKDLPMQTLLLTHVMLSRQGCATPAFLKKFTDGVTADMGSCPDLD